MKPTVDRALEALGGEGPVCAITAGWQEREAEIEALQESISRDVVNLLLHRRGDQVFQEDRDLFQAHRQRQNRLRELQSLYRLRLSLVLKAARQLMRRDGDPDLIAPERRAAIESVRTLDRHHLRRIREIHAAFEDRWHCSRRASVDRHRSQLAEILAASAALLVAGGHVAVLLNRLRLFELGALMVGKPLIAWSAGAMALSERIVLFHDSPPQGRGDPEILETGLAVFKGVLPLPHARRRLRLDDPVRVSLFASRFRPCRCVALDEGASLRWNGSDWSAGPGTRCLGEDGKVYEMGVK
ncbi:MAG: Type 1 glutamine amidotransferase-like domain-containing protein [Acidobacteriota bacterium]